MKPIKFPTIHQMMRAIECWLNSPMNSCSYDESTHQFTAPVYIETPCYDDGGSIDSSDFRIEDTVFTFESAYKMWADLEGLTIPNKLKSESPLYVDSIVDFEDDLPF